MRRALIGAALLVIAGCGGGDGPVVADDLALEMRADAEEVEFGAPFEVTVVRTWSRDLEPEPWSDELLAPLDVKSRGTRREDTASGTRETLLFEARAYARETARVPGPAWSARRTAGGSTRSVNADDLVVSVRPSVDAAAPGAVEERPGPVNLPTRWAAWMAAFGLIVSVATLLLGREQETRTLVQTASPDPVRLARELAEEQLERLRDAVAGDPLVFHSDAVQLARDFVAEATGRGTRSQTSSEILSRADLETLLSESGRDNMGKVLSTCDLVKFAAATSTQESREQVLERLATAVEGTA
ncbi:MAG: hypothetical protein ACYTG4_02940 [Planctomycetota bacterium]